MLPLERVGFIVYMIYCFNIPILMSPIKVFRLQMDQMIQQNQMKSSFLLLETHIIWSHTTISYTAGVLDLRFIKDLLNRGSCSSLFAIYVERCSPLSLTIRANNNIMFLYKIVAPMIQKPFMNGHQWQMYNQMLAWHGQNYTKVFKREFLDTQGAMKPSAKK